MNIKILSLIAICINLYGCSENNDIISKFEIKELPLYLNTEDYSVFDLFDNKTIIECNDLRKLQEKCEGHSVFKYGYVLGNTKKYNLLLYSQNVSEDTVYYKLATINYKDKVISSINVMEYCGDGPTVNGRILNNFEIYTLHREILPNSTEEDERIKTKEVETKYIIEANGIIKKASETSSQIKYYKIGRQGEFIPLE